MTSFRCVLAAAITAASLGGAARADGDSRPYLLRPGASYRLACFQPCRCNLDARGDMTGGFTLTREAASPDTRVFAVSDIRFVAAGLGAVYTGAGVYQAPGDVPGGQRLQLDLTSPQLTEHFDSGVQPPRGPLGDWPVVAVQVNYNSFECHDLVLNVVASPVADWDATGEVTIADLFAFLGGFFRAQGDANGDGVTSVEDVFAFLADYFTAA